MSDPNERSRYWMSPGIDVPTRAEILPGLRPMRGLYVCFNAGEATFVPTDEFMRMMPLWRLDVLGDIAQAIERTQQHAAVEHFRGLDARLPGLTMDRRLDAYRKVCSEGGVVLPPNVEALLVLDDQFRGVSYRGQATKKAPLRRRSSG